MGTFQRQSVIATFDNGRVYNEEVVAVKAFISSFSPDIQRLFAISEESSFSYGMTAITMFPDGSKEGREPSETADKVRQRFVALLRELNYRKPWIEWGSIEWVQVSFGERGTIIEDGSYVDDEKLNAQSSAEDYLLPSTDGSLH